MYDEIKSYVNSFIPLSLPEPKRDELFDELMCHILDKSGRYEEIGYSKEDSMKKAIEDFGTDETVKGAISAEFENLYHEKTGWAFIPAVIILLMDILGLLVGAYTMFSSDYDHNPNSIQAFVSFAMIFVNFGLIYYARVKHYKKMLVGTAVGDLIAGAFIYLSFFPQGAMYALEKSIYLPINKLTSLTLSYPDSCELAMYLASALLVLCAVYCIASAIRIKKGQAHMIKNSKKNAIFFSLCYFAVAISSSLMLLIHS